MRGEQVGGRSRESENDLGMNEKGKRETWEERLHDHISAKLERKKRKRKEVERKSAKEKKKTQTKEKEKNVGNWKRQGKERKLTK